MDYERDSGEAGQEPAEPATGDGSAEGGSADFPAQTESVGNGDTATDSEATVRAEAGASAPSDTATDEPAIDSGADLDADANVANGYFSTAPTAPEWPSADLEAAASDDITAIYAEATSLALDPGDDSDAPIQLDEAPPVGVRAQTVNLSQGGVQSIEATTVTLSQGGAGQVRADTMSVQMGGVGLARVSTLTLGSGASAFAVVADRATVEDGSNTFIVVSRSLDGDIRPTIDWRGALALGAGLGIALRLLRRLR